MSVLSAAYMHDEAAAFAHVESLLWPDGAVCPHCGVVDNAYKLTGVRSKPSKKNPEGKERHGLYKCKDCGKQFTVRKGTIFEESHIDLHLWLQAIHLMVSSKKGISSHQLARTLEITQKSAWFLAHRIREAMRDGDFSPMGGNGGTVEVDETFIGKDKNARTDVRKFNYLQKNKVLTLVDRDTRTARSVVIKDLKVATIRPILLENIAREARVVTDEAPRLKGAADGYAHETVNHGADEYVRGDVTTNTVESYFSVFKRGMRGVYQHCDQKHLHRYLAEFDFRYNNRIANGVNDSARAVIALCGSQGKRLTYRGTNASGA